MRFLVLALVVLPASPVANAPGLKDRDAAVYLTDKVMQRVDTGDIQGGLSLRRKTP